MLTGSDIKKIREGLATKDDLGRFATKKDLKQLENRIINKMNKIIDVFDREFFDIKSRLDRLEQRLSLPPISPAF